MKDVLLVDEATIEEAIALLIEIEKTVTEGAGATGGGAVAAWSSFHRQESRHRALRRQHRFAHSRSILMRNLVREGRLIRIRVRLPDVAGALIN